MRIYRNTSRHTNKLMCRSAESAIAVHTAQEILYLQKKKKNKFAKISNSGVS